MNGKTNVTTTSNSGGTNVPHIPPNDFIVAPGDAKTQITWTDPNDLYASPEGVISQAPYQLVSKWTSTKIVRSETDYPATPNDGILAVESNIRDEHKTSVFEDTNLNNGTIYYYSAFGMNEQGLYSQPSTQYAEVRAALPTPNGYFDISSYVWPYGCNVMTTKNHVVAFAAGTGPSDTTILSHTVDGTESNLGQVTPGIVELKLNSVESLNGYGISIGGTDEDRGYSQNAYWHIMSPELTLQWLHDYSSVKTPGLATTNNYVIRCGGNGTAYCIALIRAYDLNGTITEIESLSNNDVYTPFGSTIDKFAVFINNTTLRYDTAYTDELTKMQLPYNTAPNNYSMTWGNTPNHVIFHPGNSQGYAYDSSLTRSNVSAFSYSREYCQGITLGNYAMFIGGSHGSYINSGDGPRHDELYQILYFDITLTLTEGKQIDNPIDANPGTPQAGPWMIINNSDVYTLGGTIGDIGLIQTSRNLNGRYYRFKLA